MFDIETSSVGTKFALLEGDLLHNKLDADAFVTAARELGIPSMTASEAAPSVLIGERMAEILTA